ncbi:uncharacterized protein LOC107610609 isoform X4 [Arachis ipaensis]|uniref:uncharacterized protein LOC107610609 isoform X4 n=1 Tax=Arachis ipaensis TaxID=130454 RepID=UPI000A2B64FC|nr:uncharacterized protein LOC107610609 isoform X4 [Arachis ipaensis]
MRSENRTPIFFSFFFFSISLSLSLSIIPVISRSHNSHRRSGSGSHNKTWQKGKEKVTRTSSGSLPHGTTNEEGSWFHIRETSLIFACYQPQDHLKMLCVMLVSLVVWSPFVVGSENLAANHDVMQIVEVLDDRARDKRLVALPEKYHKSQRGWKVVSIQGDKAQHDHTKALSLFKNGSFPLMGLASCSRRMG